MGCSASAVLDDVAAELSDAAHIRFPTITPKDVPWLVRYTVAKLERSAARRAPSKHKHDFVANLVLIAVNSRGTAETKVFLEAAGGALVYIDEIIQLVCHAARGKAVSQDV